MVIKHEPLKNYVFFTGHPIAILGSYLSSLQVTATPKKRPKPETEDTSKPVEPLTYKEKALSSMDELLNAAAVSRTRSITLKGLDFAEQLAATMLDFANATENLYSDIQTTIKKDNATEKEFKVLCRKIEEKSITGKKLKAPLPSSNVYLNGYGRCQFDQQRSQYSGYVIHLHGHPFIFKGVIPTVLPIGISLPSVLEAAADAFLSANNKKGKTRKGPKKAKK